MTDAAVKNSIQKDDRAFPLESSSNPHFMNIAEIGEKA
jgi:hypothetical protein